MTEYVNGFQVHVNEIARIKCYDASQLQVNPKEVVEIAMTWENLKELHTRLGEIIEMHTARLEAVRKAN